MAITELETRDTKEKSQLNKLALKCEALFSGFINNKVSELEFGKLVFEGVGVELVYAGHITKTSQGSVNKIQNFTISRGDNYFRLIRFGNGKTVETTFEAADINGWTRSKDLQEKINVFNQILTRLKREKPFFEI